MPRIDSSIPDPTKELERKTTDTLGIILEKIQAAEWSFQRALDALDTLWGVTSGLVSREAMDEITAAHSYCRAMQKKGHFDYTAVLQAKEAGEKSKEEQTMGSW